MPNFEAWDPKGRRSATVIAGQTWHWVDPVAGTAKAGEVLQPEGRLAVFWTCSSPSPTSGRLLLRSTAGCYLTRPFSEEPRPVWRHIRDRRLKRRTASAREGGFGEPEQWRFDWERPYSATSGWTRYPRSAATINYHLPS